MTKRDIPPDSLPRSRSGRIPRWVVDEAMGKPPAPVPFRGPTTPAARRGRRWARKPVIVLLVIVVLIAAGLLVVRLPG